MGQANGDERRETGVALKEWASAIRALREGTQIMLLRKGGIVEETRDFELLAPSFHLLPTYEHQREALLKPAFRQYVPESLADWDAKRGVVRMDTFAEVAEELEVSDSEMLGRLRGHHIWTDDFAAERLRWKKTKPLHVLLLRVWRMESPAELPLLPAYTGCKSWVRLENGAPTSALEPVLSDAAFRVRVQAVKDALAGGPDA